MTDDEQRGTALRFLALAQPEPFRRFREGEARCCYLECPGKPVHLLVVVTTPEDILREHGSKLTERARQNLDLPVPEGAVRLAVATFPACVAHRGEHRGIVDFVVRRECQDLMRQAVEQSKTAVVDGADETDGSELNVLTTVTFFPPPPSH